MQFEIQPTPEQIESAWAKNQILAVVKSKLGIDLTEDQFAEMMEIIRMILLRQIGGSIRSTKKSQDLADFLISLAQESSDPIEYYLAMTHELQQLGEIYHQKSEPLQNSVGVFGPIFLDKDSSLHQEIIDTDQIVHLGCLPISAIQMQLILKKIFHNRQLPEYVVVDSDGFVLQHLERVPQLISVQLDITSSGFHEWLKDKMTEHTVLLAENLFSHLQTQGILSQVFEHFLIGLPTGSKLILIDDKNTTVKLQRVIKANSGFIFQHGGVPRYGNVQKMYQNLLSDQPLTGDLLLPEQDFGMDESGNFTIVDKPDFEYLLIEKIN